MDKKKKKNDEPHISTHVQVVFVISWVLVVVTAFVIGTITGIGLMSILSPSTMLGQLSASMLSISAGVSVFALALAMFQSKLLHRLLGVQLSGWFQATFLGWLIVLAVPVFVAFLQRFGLVTYFDDDISRLYLVLISFVVTVPSLMQWFVLRQHVQRAWHWVAIPILAVVLAAPAFLHFSLGALAIIGIIVYFVLPPIIMLSFAKPRSDPPEQNYEALSLSTPHESSQRSQIPESLVSS